MKQNRFWPGLGSLQSSGEFERMSGHHPGVMARTPDLMQRAYLGTEIRDEVLHFEPRLPGPIQELSFTVRFRRTPLLVTLNKNGLTLALHPEGEIARANDAGLLTAAHADIVVTTLDDIDLSALANGRLATKKA